MDLLKVGKFIAEQRKAKKLTQVQLAEKIGISEKTVSKWECGKGFPDTSLMLPLCEALNISANELLSGKKLSNEEYKLKAEENIAELTKQNNYKDRLLLGLEYVIVGFSIAVLLACCAIASFVVLDEVYRILIVALGLVLCFVGLIFSLVIEKDAGQYKCGNCGHKYSPSFKTILNSMHMGRTRYLKCPKCGKRTWSKKVVEKD